MKTIGAIFTNIISFFLSCVSSSCDFFKETKMKYFVCIGREFKRQHIINTASFMVKLIVLTDTRSFEHQDYHLRKITVVK